MIIMISTPRMRSLSLSLWFFLPPLLRKRLSKSEKIKEKRKKEHLHTHTKLSDIYNWKSSTFFFFFFWSWRPRGQGCRQKLGNRDLKHFRLMEGWVAEWGTSWLGFSCCLRAPEWTEFQPCCLLELFDQTFFLRFYPTALGTVPLWSAPPQLSCQIYIALVIINCYM